LEKRRRISEETEEILGAYEPERSTWSDILANEFDSSGRVHGI